MLNDALTTYEADETTGNTYTLVKREGYESLRRELTKSSDLNWKMEVKNTIDLNSPDKPNRHLISISRGVEDAVTGELQTVTAHCVITRHKDVTDAVVNDVAHELGTFLNQTSWVSDVLQGAS